MTIYDQINVQGNNVRKRVKLSYMYCNQVFKMINVNEFFCIKTLYT